MTQVFQLDVFRSTRKRELAVSHDDGQDPQAASNEAAAAPELELIRSQADSTASVVAEGFPGYATASRAVETGSKQEAAAAALPPLRRIAREELDILLWDVTEYLARFASAGGGLFPYHYQRSTLQPAIDEAQVFCLLTKGDPSDVDAVLTPEQFQKVEQLKVHLRKLRFDLTAAVRRIRGTA